MKNKTTLFGILGVLLFALTSFIGAYLIEDYSMLSQYISESYTIDTKYGLYLRYIGFIPSGIFIFLFNIRLAETFNSMSFLKRCYYAVAIFYGIATILVSLFPCDSGCNKAFIDPSFSQIIHSIVGLLTYLVLPICFLLIGLRLKKITVLLKFSILSIIIGIVSLLLVFILFSNPNSDYLGLVQRLIESLFMLWIIGNIKIVLFRKRH